MSMLRSKAVLTALTLAVIVGLVPASFGQIRLVIAGSSAMFNTAALGAYNGGSGPVGAVAPTYHWSYKADSVSKVANLNLQDQRVNPVNNDAAQVWVVWDSSTTGVGGAPNIWVYAKVDTVVGDRCFFAVPACKLLDTSGTNAGWTANGQGLVSSTLWGVDTTSLPSNVLNIVENTSNMAVNVGASDIRPEDAWFADNRVNSALGASSFGGANSDGLDGLGYNSNNAAGIAPNYVTATTGSCTGISTAKAVGTPIYSAFQHTGTSTDAANVLTFNILGKDPVTCTAIPTYDVSNVGGEPVVFVFSRNGGQLAGLANASEYQLQQVFSGVNTDASALGLAANPINAYLREPLSGTMNTTEATVFRYPTLYSTGASAQNFVGLSQETGVGTPTAGTSANPLAAKSAGGSGYRFRGIGTGEVVNSVLCSATSSPSSCGGAFSNTISNVDGIAYTFFSYGNVANLGDSANYGYITLNGVDGIFTSYNGIGDFGQPNPASYGGALGVLPKNGENGISFPACENHIWKYGYSFPNLRNGTYRAWNVLRLLYPSSQLTPVKNLIAASNVYAVTSIPDYVPFAKVTPVSGACPAVTGGIALTSDPGLLVWRSHYQQRDGNGKLLGKGNAVNTNTADVGGDMGGAILIYETSALGITDTVTQLTQGSNANNLSPYLRPSN